jgi:hypothetical protein
MKQDKPIQLFNCYLLNSFISTLTLRLLTTVAVKNLTMRSCNILDFSWSNLSFKQWSERKGAAGHILSLKLVALPRLASVHAH